MFVGWTAAIAIETGRGLACSTGSYEDYCDDVDELDTWFTTDSASQLSWAGALLACLVLPFTVGFVVRRWGWGPVSPVVILIAGVLGLDAGERIMELLYPNTYFGNPPNGLGILLAIVAGVPISAVAAIWGVLLGKAFGLRGAGLSRLRAQSKQ